MLNIWLSWQQVCWSTEYEMFAFINIYKFTFCLSDLKEVCLFKALWKLKLDHMFLGSKPQTTISPGIEHLLYEVSDLWPEWGPGGD